MAAGPEQGGDDVGAEMSGGSGNGGNGIGGGNGGPKASGGRRGRRMSTLEWSVDAADGSIEMLVEAHLPSRCHSLSDLSNRLADLGLNLLDATSTAEGDMVKDEFRVRAPVPVGVTAKQAATDLQSKLQLLGAHAMRPGDAALARAADGSSRLSRLVQIGDSTPTVALIDLGILGAKLALAPRDSRAGDDAVLWRRFLRCHAPHLLPSKLHGKGTDPEEALRIAEASAPADLQIASSLHNKATSAIRVGATPDASDAVGAHPTTGKAWFDAICAFLLYRLRQANGEGEVGVGFYDLEVGPKLGEGGYGVVRLARHRVSGTLYAVKSIMKSRIRRIGEERTFELLERERRTLKLLASSARHLSDGLTRLICSGHDAEWLRLVMPAYLGGDLSALLDAVGKPLPDEAVQFYAGCLVLALQTLHGLGVAFRDLKPENVLLSADGWPVLTDFGLVAFIGPSYRNSRDSRHSVGDGSDGEGGDYAEYAYSMVGTPEFMSPEVVDGSGHTTDADYWSLGVTICELLTLHTPFRESSDEQHAHQKTYANILNGTYSKAFTKEHYRRLEQRTASLLDGLMKRDPALRLGGRRRGVESLRVHPFFWGLSWEDLEQRALTPPHVSITEKHSSATAPFATTTPPSPPRRAAAASPGLARRGSAPAAASAPPIDAAAAALDRMFDFSDWGVSER